MMNASGSQAALRDLKAAALAEQHVAARYANVCEAYFGMAVRRVVITEDRQRALDLDSRCVHRYQDHRLLQMRGRSRIGFAHEDEDLAARAAAVRRPPLAAVYDVLIAIYLDARGDVRRVRRCDAGFRHRESRADLAAQERLEPPFLLLLVAVANEGFHVARVGRIAIERFRRDMRTAHDLAYRRVLGVAEACAVLAFRQKEIPQPRSARFGFHLFHDR